MGRQQDRKFLHEIFEKERWKFSLERFIQVLRINIFVVDSDGVPLIPPCGTARSQEYGCRLATSFFDFSNDLTEQNNFLSKFSPYGDYLEYRTRMALHVFAIPLKIYNKTVAYLIIGPVIMGKRLENEQYLNLAEEAGITREGILDDLHGVKAISYVTLTAVLDLLASVTRDFIAIGLDNRRLRKAQMQEIFPLQDIERVAEGVSNQIHTDDLLASVLDIALHLTGAEVGSIMVFDKQSHEMMIRVSQGVNEEWVKNTRVRMGQGLSGLAAQENQCFIMEGNKGDAAGRLANFLKRPEIKEAIIMPIAHKNRVFGVINLHSKKKGSRIKDNSGCLVSLSKLLSTAVFSQG